MKLRIVSDGTAGGTRIENVDTGEDITHNVRSMVWRVESGRASLEITLVRVEHEVQLTAET